MEEIGRRLRAAREAKQIELAVAEEETKIRRKYIEALEDGREADIPGEAYLKGFLRSYGNYLGLDGPALVDEFKERERAALEGSREAAAAEPSVQRRMSSERPAKTTAPSAAPQPAPSLERTRTKAVARKPRHTPTPATRRALTTTVIVVAVAAALIYGGMQLFGGESTPGPTTPSTPDPVVTKPPEPAPTPTPTPPTPAPAKVTLERGQGKIVNFTVSGVDGPIALEIIPTGDKVWVEAYGPANEKLYFDMSKAEPIKVSAETIRVEMGHMVDVNLVVNGQRFDKPLTGGPFTLIFKKS